MILTALVLQSYTLSLNMPLFKRDVSQLIILMTEFTYKQSQGILILFMGYANRSENITYEIALDFTEKMAIESRELTGYYKGSPLLNSLNQICYVSFIRFLARNLELLVMDKFKY